MLDRHVFHDDLDIEGGERLLAWCRSHGADAFTLTTITTGPDITDVERALDAQLQDHVIAPERIRRIPESEPGRYWSQPSRLWALNETTSSVLLGCLPDGLLTYTPGGLVWFEDPCLYRGDELMLGIISHEREGILRIQPSEQLALDQSGIVYRLKGAWVGY